MILGQTNNSPPHRQWEKQLVVGLLAANDCCIAFDAWDLNGKSHRDVFTVNIEEENVCRRFDQGPVLLLRHDAVAGILANGSAAFIEGCAAIGWNSCDSVR